MDSNSDSENEVEWVTLSPSRTEIRKQAQDLEHISQVFPDEPEDILPLTPVASVSGGLDQAGETAAQAGETRPKPSFKQRCT